MAACAASYRMKSNVYRLHTMFAVYSRLITIDDGKPLTMVGTGMVVKLFIVVVHNP